MAALRESDPVAARLPVLAARDLTVTFHGRAALRGISLDVQRGGLTAIIGQSGCGKSTLLRIWNRSNDRVHGMCIEGSALFLGQDVYARDVDATELRRRVGMVFQRPVVFPMTIFENVAYGRRVHRLDTGPGALAEHVERCLVRSGLWDEVKDRLRHRATELSGGQQQRLAIARALAVEPEVILLD